MEQSKIDSFAESCVNTSLSYVIAVVSQLIIFPVFDIQVPLSDNFKMAAYFVLVGMVRSYVVRRWFNGKVKSLPQKVAHHDS